MSSGDRRSSPDCGHVVYTRTSVPIRREGRCHTLHSTGEIIKCPMSSPLQQGLALYLVGLITHPSLSSPVLHYSRIEIGQIPYSIERSGRENCTKKPGYYHTRYATNLHTCSLYYYGMYIYVRQVGIPVAKLQGCLFYSLLCRRLTVGSAAGERTP